jgi:hypothetical protein
MTSRRFPAPWTEWPEEPSCPVLPHHLMQENGTAALQHADKMPGCFVLRDANGQALAKFCLILDLLFGGRLKGWPVLHLLGIVDDGIGVANTSLLWLEFCDGF